MPVEKSAGVIVFKKESSSAPDGALTARGEKILFLLLHYPSAPHRAEKEYWDLPKGHIEKGENILETARREVLEETGLDNLKFIDDFKETIRYFFRWEGKNILKFVTFFLAESGAKDVRISEEHIGYDWLLFDDAVSRLTFKNAKEILRKANDFLLEKDVRAAE